MPAPYPRRGPQQGVARAVNRGAKGMAQGRFSGLSRVQRSNPGRVDAGGIQWMYDGNNVATFTGNFGLVDSFGGDSALSPVYHDDDTFTMPWASSTASTGVSIDIAETGLYSVNWELTVDVDQAAVVHLVFDATPSNYQTASYSTAWIPPSGPATYRTFQESYTVPALGGSEGFYFSVASDYAGTFVTSFVEIFQIIRAD